MEGNEESFKQNLVDLMRMQQVANKQNLTLHVSVLIMQVLLFLLMMILVMFK